MHSRKLVCCGDALVAVITGAGSGIGQAVAVSLAKRGVKALGLVDRNESVRTVAEMINEENGDGKKIALSRGTTNSDAVLIRQKN